MKVILVTGLKQSGKNLFTDYILENTLNFINLSFAEPIKQVGKILFGWNIKHEEGILKEKVDPLYGISPRAFYQFFGTEFAQYYLPESFMEFKTLIGKRLWVKIIEQKLNDIKNKNVIISDWRFPHEYSMLKNFNPIRVRIINNTILQTDRHESEKHISIMPVDYEILNNGKQLKPYFKNIDNFINKSNIT